MELGSASSCLWMVGTRTPWKRHALRRQMVSSKLDALKKVLKGMLGEGFSLGGSLKSEVPSGPSSTRYQG